MSSVEVLREMIKENNRDDILWQRERADVLKDALLALEKQKKLSVLFADIKERLALHEVNEPSEYILADLKLFIEEREKELLK